MPHLTWTVGRRRPRASAARVDPERTRPPRPSSGRIWLPIIVFVAVNSLIGQTTALASPAPGAPTIGKGAIVVANMLANTIDIYGPGSDGNTTPLLTLSGRLDVPSAMAFDADGDLWVANFTSHSVEEYLPSDLGSGAKAPAITITSDQSSSLNSPAALAFDAEGNLWVADDLSNTLVEYSKASLASGPVTPATTISSDNANSLYGPYALAFDSDGDLWVGNYDTSTIVEYPKNELVDGPQVPSVTITTDRSRSLNSPAGLAFDTSGDLWVASNLNSTLLEYSRAELTSGAQPPIVTISANGSGNIASPEGLAFDPAGNLWVANYGDDSLAEFSPWQLAGSGSWAPNEVIAGPGTGLHAPGPLAVMPGPSTATGATPLASVSRLALAPGHGLARLEIGCKRARCSGMIEVFGCKDGGGRRVDRVGTNNGATLLGSVRYSVARGRAGRFSVHLRAAARDLLIRMASYHLSAELVVTVRGGATINSPFV